MPYFTEDRYFVNRNGDCFGCSLANLFAFRGDWANAIRVFSGFWAHDLVEKSGAIDPPLAARVADDLTTGYEARVTLRYGLDSWGMAGLGGGNKPTMKIMASEEERGATKFNAEAEEFEDKPPFILFANPFEIGNHAMLVIDRGAEWMKVVDNGYLRTTKDLLPKSMGTFSIVKKK